MLDRNKLRRDHEFEASFTGQFKRTLTDLRAVLTMDDYDLTQKAVLVCRCWDEFYALHVFLTSGMAEFVSESYTGTHGPDELERDFQTFISVILQDLEHAANARYKTEPANRDSEDGSEAQRILAWIKQVQAVRASKARTGANNEN